MPDAPFFLLICADANEQIGAGHAVRSLALAQEWIEQGGRATLFGQVSLVWVQRELSSSGVSYIESNKSQRSITVSELVSRFPEIQTGNSWLCLDGYEFSLQLLQDLREDNINVLLLDDMGEKKFCPADIILNQNLNAENRYNYPNAKAQLLGSSYSLLRRAIVQDSLQFRGSKDEDIISILVGLGAADNTEDLTNVISKIEKCILANEQPFELLIIPGSSRIEEIESSSNKDFDIQVLKRPQDIIEFYRRANLAVIAAGSSCWELMLYKLPLLLVKLAENQEVVFDELISVGLAQSFSQKNLQDAISLISSEDAYDDRVYPVDGYGAMRTVNRMLSPIRER